MAKKTLHEEIAEIFDNAPIKTDGDKVEKRSKKGSGLVKKLGKEAKEIGKSLVISYGVVTIFYVAGSLLFYPLVKFEANYESREYHRMPTIAEKQRKAAFRHLEANYLGEVVDFGEYFIGIAGAYLALHGYWSSKTGELD